MRYEEIEIGEIYVVPNRGGWVAKVEKKFKSTEDGTEYIALEDPNGRWGAFNYPHQVERLDGSESFRHTALIKNAEGKRRTVRISLGSYQWGDVLNAVKEQYGETAKLYRYQTITITN